MLQAFAWGAPFPLPPAAMLRAGGAGGKGTWFKFLRGLTGAGRLLAAGGLRRRMGPCVAPRDFTGAGGAAATAGEGKREVGLQADGLAWRSLSQHQSTPQSTPSQHPVNTAPPAPFRLGFLGGSAR